MRSKALSTSSKAFAPNSDRNSDAELERYARHIVLPRFGGVGQQRLKAARVAVIGAGGIGSGAIPALAATGIGSLTIIDNDLVDRSNLQRQPIFRDDQVGGEKARLAAEFATSIDENAVHGSDSLENAKTEIAYFFRTTELCPRTR